MAQTSASSPTLYLSPRYTSDSVALWKQATAENWRVDRLASHSQIPEAPTGDIAIYGEPFFASAVAASTGCVLLEAPFDWLTRIPENLTGRQVEYTTLATARQLRQPSFIKPVDDKCFTARVYDTGDDLPGFDELDGDLPVLVAEPVAWLSEYRCFVLEGTVRAFSVYMRSGKLAQEEDESWPSTEAEVDEAMRFADIVLGTPGAELPPATVLDIGIIEGRGWAVVEANPAWASGIYGCDPAEVLPVIKRSCVRLDTLSVCDSRWVIDRAGERAA